MPKKQILSNSIQLLYTIFVLTVINLGYFVLYKDSQSLFLFMSVSIVVYLIECNMIYALLYPLIIVNGLNLLRKVINVEKEGFELNESGSISGKVSNEEKKLMIEWIQDKLNSDEEFMMEYTNYDESIDDKMPSLNTILDNISNVEIEEEGTYLEDVNDLISYIKKIKKMDVDDVNEDELAFVDNMLGSMMDEIEFGDETEETDETDETEGFKQTRTKPDKKNRTKPGKKKFRKSKKSKTITNK